MILDLLSLIQLNPNQDERNFSRERTVTNHGSADLHSDPNLLITAGKDDGRQITEDVNVRLNPL